MREELDVAGPAGWSACLRVIGVDFGANRLRVAVDGPLGPRLVQSSGDEWLPRLVRRRGTNGDLELVALKNLLDFEASVPVGPAGVPSQEYVARILRERSGAARAASGNGQAGWVLSVPPCF
ncbi:MAG: hypothetical protein HZB13_02750 [Acidobacteria bacterium]|nr:hypothetical protein [Acidobacteriota bacterium]